MTRELSPSIARCELTHLERVRIDFDTALEQHHRYVECLVDLGYRVQELPPEPNQPDAVFIEDTAVVLDELAIITRPGAESRRDEIRSVALALLDYRELFLIEEPGTLDGGDVLVVGRTLYAGRSGRTNRDGIEQLERIVADRGYEVVPVKFHGCLHLKSAVTQIAESTLLVNSDWVDPGSFPEMQFLEVDPAEPRAANALLLGETVVYPEEYASTRGRMEAEGIQLVTVPASELAKAEGGVTCCSLILEDFRGE